MEIRGNINYLLNLILLIIVCFLTYKNYTVNKQTDRELVMLEKQYKEENVHSVIYYDQVIEKLKSSNKSLYDSIKSYKKQIDYLIEFKYNKKYIIDTVYVDTINKVVNTYEYYSNKNDTLNYNLKIGSTSTPSWYSLNLSISDKFTIVNKKNGELNNITIKHNNEGNIEDVTVFRKKEKNNFLKRFALGPSISAGYDLAKKEPEFIVGISLTYNLLGN